MCYPARTSILSLPITSAGNSMYHRFNSLWKQIAHRCIQSSILLEDTIMIYTSWQLSRTTRCSCPPAPSAPKWLWKCNASLQCNASDYGGWCRGRNRNWGVGGRDSFNWIETCFLDFLCMFFWQILIPYWRSSRIYKTDIKDLSEGVFSKVLHVIEIARSPKTIYFNVLDVSCLFKVCRSKVKNNWFGGSWTFPLGPKTMKWRLVFLVSDS